MTEIKVKNVFPITNGIMATISRLCDFGFNDDIDLLLLSKCGKRNITPVVEMLLDNSENLSQEAITRLAWLIIQEYGDSWKRIKEALNLEYNPLTASIYHEEETTDTEGETGDNSNEVLKKDVSAIDIPPDNYVTDDQNRTESSATGTSKTTAKRILDRTSNVSSYKNSDLVISEIEMRVNSRFISQVIEDVKNYIAMMIY